MTSPGLHGGLRVPTPAVLLAAVITVLAATIATLVATVDPDPPGVVFQHRSPERDLIVRDRDDGVRELLFAPGSAIQSAIRLDRPDQLVLPYTRSMMAALAVVPEPQRVLMIGLGGGAMVRFLLLAYPRASVDAVEIDPLVVEVARRYFELPDEPRLRVHVGDGRLFVEQSTGLWDLVILDAYSAEGVPLALTTREFLSAVRARTEAHGVVAANVWSASRNPLHGSMMATFLDTFEQLLVVTAPATSNSAFLALPKAIVHPDEVLPRRVSSIRVPAVRALALEATLRAGLDADPRPPADAHVLTDADGRRNPGSESPGDRPGNG